MASSIQLPTEGFSNPHYLVGLTAQGISLPGPDPIMASPIGLRPFSASGVWAASRASSYGYGSLSPCWLFLSTLIRALAARQLGMIERGFAA